MLYITFLEMFILPNCGFGLLTGISPFSPSPALAPFGSLLLWTQLFQDSTYKWYEVFFFLHSVFQLACSREALVIKKRGSINMFYGQGCQGQREWGVQWHHRPRPALRTHKADPKSASVGGICWISPDSSFCLLSTLNWKIYLGTQINHASRNHRVWLLTLPSGGELEFTPTPSSYLSVPLICANPEMSLQIGSLVLHSPRFHLQSCHHLAGPHGSGGRGAAGSRPFAWAIVLSLTLERARHPSSVHQCVGQWGRSKERVQEPGNKDLSLTAAHCPHGSHPSCSFPPQLDGPAGSLQDPFFLLPAPSTWGLSFQNYFLLRPLLHQLLNAPRPVPLRDSFEVVLL